MDPFLGYRSVPDQYLLTGRNPVFFPIWLKQLRIAGIYSGTKLMCFCTGQATDTENTDGTDRYGTEFHSLDI